MSDSFGRNIHYLRVSVTDRCDFRCFYCAPSPAVQWLPKPEILGYSELARVIRIAAGIGITKVRITGGEPLMRPGLVFFIQEIRKIAGIRELSMTTNGSRLAEYAAELRQAGLDRVNVSLDTLQRQRFLQITGRDMFSRVLTGIEAAEQAGLTPVKINVVVAKGINDDELADFARLTRERNYQIRFIECMPFQPYLANKKALVSVQQMKEILAAEGFGTLNTEQAGDGPANVYRIPGALGTLGFISPVTNHFCESCNRIRLTADGVIKPCLLSNEEFSIKRLMRAGVSDSELAAYLMQAVRAKPSRHCLNEEPVLQRNMSKIGG